jgi:hypothetical protein
MKRILTWCFLGLVVLGSAMWSQAQETAGTEQAVAALAGCGKTRFGELEHCTHLNYRRDRNRSQNIEQRAKESSSSPVSILNVKNPAAG